MPYCTGTGSLRCSRSRKASICSGPAVEPSCETAGSPGSCRTRAKITIDAPNNWMIESASRFAISRPSIVTTFAQPDSEACSSSSRLRAVAS